MKVPKGDAKWTILVADLNTIFAIDFHEPQIHSSFRNLVFQGSRAAIGRSFETSSDTMLDKYSDLKQKLSQLFDRTTLDAIALLLSEPETKTITLAALPDWMTASQLARYWQLVNANGEPTTAGIMKWARRPEDEHPLPHAYMGDLLRFHRAEVDVWAREEGDRRRVQNEQRRLRIA